MRLSNAAHTSRPWRIHELTRNFRLEDVWALPAQGDLDDFTRLVQQMAVLVKPNGLLGIFYMAVIKPFRHLIVYPALMREIERNWRAAATDPTSAPANADAATPEGEA